MQTQLLAIHNAINVDNAAAAALDPPHPKLEWETISHYHFIEEFTLLNNTHTDIREKPWAQPAMQEMLQVARHLARAQEELVRSRGLTSAYTHTHIRDVNTLLTTVLNTLAARHEIIYGAVSEYATRRHAANMLGLTGLNKLYVIPKFSGDPTPSTHVNTTVPEALRRMSISGREWRMRMCRSESLH
ncbi:hypothetical protein NUW54_g3360 [Trametes sanguinea]|uniref:Uncharacterized protein n=1 Tax=Trametes sanguinea TaxID=158606 RepID=A0ACC1Q4L1_9APHY|nr:hypothetical protein NUW54_g3360 [Trametes sanguinea]